MTVKEAFESLHKALSKIYESREAGNIATIVFEDAFPDLPLHEKGLSFSKEQADRYQEIKQRLVKHEPLQYVLGEADFYGLRFKTDKRALIPRPETEEIVHLIIKDIRKIDEQGTDLRLLDVGAGTGCIPLTIKHHIRELTVHAMDVSPGALDLAFENAKALELDVHFHLMDVLDEKQWDTLPDFNLIVSNPPYIPVVEKKLMTKNVLDFEPEVSLFVEDEEPIVFYKKIAQLAKQKLLPGGLLYFEANEFNAETVADYLKAHNFKMVEVIKDLQARDRIIKARISTS